MNNYSKDCQRELDYRLSKWILKNLEQLLEPDEIEEIWTELLSLDNMKICIIALGSRGDVQPYAALARIRKTYGTKPLTFVKSNELADIQILLSAVIDICH